MENCSHDKVSTVNRSHYKISPKALKEIKISGFHRDEGNLAATRSWSWCVYMTIGELSDTKPLSLSLFLSLFPSLFYIDEYLSLVSLYNECALCYVICMPTSHKIISMEIHSKMYCILIRAPGSIYCWIQSWHSPLVQCPDLTHINPLVAMPIMWIPCPSSGCHADPVWFPWQYGNWWCRQGRAWRSHCHATRWNSTPSWSQIPSQVNWQHLTKSLDPLKPLLCHYLYVFWYCYIQLSICAYWLCWRDDKVLLSIGSSVD